MRLRQFVAATITPVVLIVGFLSLAVLHFHGALQAAQKQNDVFRNFVAYNAGPYGTYFQRDSSLERPLLRYDNQNVMQYLEEGSAVVVDGQVYLLWDQSHSYTFQDGSKQIYSTVSGPGWQVVQVTTVQSSSISVAYSFVTTGVTNENVPAGTPPRTVTLTIVHQHNYWLNPSVTGLHFQADITTLFQDQDPSQAPSGAVVRPKWEITVDAEPAPGVDGSMTPGLAAGPWQVSKGGTYTWGNEFVTNYTMATPSLNTLVPVATESIHGQVAAQ